MTKKMTNQYKIIIVGDKCSGKSTFIKRYQTGDFEKVYYPSEKPLVHSIEIKENIFNCWDVPSKYSGSLIYEGSDAAIVMFDITSSTYESTDIWINEIKKVCGNIPIIVIANKVDDIKNKNIKIDNQYLLYSSRSNYNYEKPFINIIDRLNEHDKKIDE